MKKIVAPIALFYFCCPAAYAEAPKLFGNLFVQGYYSDANFDADKKQLADKYPTYQGSGKYGEDDFHIKTYKSTIGLRGSEPISATTDVVYQFQFGVNLTESNGSSVDLPNRSNYLGLKNDTWGTIRAGRYWTPVDLINNVVVAKGIWDNNGTTQLSKTTQSVNALNMTDAVPRVSNVLFWQSPERKDLPFELFVMYQADEDNEYHNGEGFGSYLTYKPNNGLVASVAYDKDLEISGSLVRGTATYDLAKSTNVPVTLGALYQVADYDGYSEKEKGMVLSAKLGLSNFARPASVYAQYNRSTDLHGISGADSNQIAIGGEYNFKDNVIAHAYMGYNKAKDVEGYLGTQEDANGELTPLYAKGDSDYFAIGTGLQYKF